MLTWTQIESAAGAAGWKRAGVEWRGPCPACGGRDRAHVRPGSSADFIGSCRGCDIDGIALAPEDRGGDGVLVAWTVGELMRAFYARGGRLHRAGRPGDWELIRRACVWIDHAAIPWRVPSGNLQSWFLGNTGRGRKISLSHCEQTKCHGCNAMIEKTWCKNTHLRLARDCRKCLQIQGSVRCNRVYYTPLHLCQAWGRSRGPLRLVGLMVNLAGNWTTSQAKPSENLAIAWPCSIGTMNPFGPARIPMSSLSV